LRERVTQLVKLHRAEAKGKPPREIYRWVESPGPVTVREESIQGEASVELALPGGHEYLDLWLPTGLFEILLDDENADGAVLVVLPDGALEAHVIECKRTVDGTHWDKALRQMKWTLVKLRALAGALGAPIAGAVLYTAFREDRLSARRSRRTRPPRRGSWASPRARRRWSFTPDGRGSSAGCAVESACWASRGPSRTGRSRWMPPGAAARRSPSGHVERAGNVVFTRGAKSGTIP
jgi:hypothetical protein